MLFVSKTLRNFKIYLVIFEGAEDANGQIHYEGFIKELMKERE